MPAIMSSFLQVRNIHKLEALELEGRRAKVLGEGSTERGRRWRAVPGADSPKKWSSLTVERKYAMTFIIAVGVIPRLPGLLPYFLQVRNIHKLEALLGRAVGPKYWEKEVQRGGEGGWNILFPDSLV